MPNFVEHRKQNRFPQKPIVVFYHADCTDGFTAAWVAWKKFGSKAEYVAIFHGDAPPAIKNKIIYTLDFTFPEAVTKQLIQDNIQVTSIDHHISAKAVTLMTQSHSYALGHSGATLAWNYFFSGKKTPAFLLNVEDEDLWRNKIQSSRSLYVYLDLFDFSFRTWSQLIRRFETPIIREHILKIGRVLVDHEDKIIERHINKNAKLVEFEGYRVYAINESGLNTSQIGAKLAKMQPPLAIVWRENKDGDVLVSLRGAGQIDTSLIAQKYSGGGHKSASAFKLASLGDIPWKTIKQNNDKSK